MGTPYYIIYRGTHPNILEDPPRPSPRGRERLYRKENYRKGNVKHRIKSRKSEKRSIPFSKNREKWH